jgi:hypothetical protein
MAALLAPTGNPSELADVTVLKSAVTVDKQAASATKIKAAITNILADAGLDPAKFDPVSTTFTANRQGVDRVLELVRIEVTGNGVSITNPSVPDDGKGSASVQITPTTTTVTALPAPPANTTLGTLDHVASLLEACLADAPAVRVTAKDAGGLPTAYSAACNAMPIKPTYKSGGLTIAQRYFNLLTSADYTGAKFGKPEILFTNATTGTVFFRMPYKTAAGVGGIITDIAEKTNPVGKPYQWEVAGNQRDYDSAVDVRLDNTTQLNPNNSAEANKSQYRVGLRLFFNPATTAGFNVQAVRVKGPGLPATGVVMHRSNVCGTNDYMTITNKTGLLQSSTGGAILFNGASTNNFKLSAALKTGTYDWTKVATSSSWRDTPLADPDLASIPSFAEYTWELWTFGAGYAPRNSATLTNTTPADVTYKQRITSLPPAIGSLKTLPWNTINSTDYLNPASTLASAQSSVTVSWNPIAEPVDYASAFGQKHTVVSGVVPASFIRTSADTSSFGVKLGATSSTVSPATDDRAGTSSLLGITLTSPNCAGAQFPLLDSVVGTKDAVNSYATYRDVTVRSRAFNLSRKYVTNSWNNFID